MAILKKHVLLLLISIGLMSDVHLLQEDGMVTPPQLSCVVEPPTDAVVNLHENAKFSCKIKGDIETEAVTWRRTVQRATGNEDEVIFATSPPNLTIDKTKYAFTETDPLTTAILVKNVGFSDAGTYRCVPMMHISNAKSANLVVIESPQVLVTSYLVEGQPANLTCRMRYMGSDQIEESDIKPYISAKLGETLLNSKVTESEINDDDSHYRQVLSYRENMTAARHGQVFRCTVRVKSTALPYEVSSSKSLIVNFSVRNITVERKQAYFPGESIRCEAEGFPQPRFKWEQLTSADNGILTGNSKPGPLLKILESMEGDNTWRCNTSNLVNGKEYFAVSKVISFTVETSAGCPTCDIGSLEIAVICLSLAAVAMALGAVLLFSFRKRVFGGYGTMPGKNVPEGSTNPQEADAEN